jgi:SAM-dependent methyltransferase
MIFDKIVITSISGRDAIAEQLCRMGFTPERQFVCVGRYPQAYLDAFSLLSKELIPFFDLQNKKCLHIGPGGGLGLEVLLYCCGAAKICSIDKFAFNICYPEITNCLGDYTIIKDSFGNFLPQTEQKEKALIRFNSIFEKRHECTFIDERKITYTHPMDVCDLSYANETFDLVVSFAVLEHVTDPDAAAAEIARVLKPGGISLHKIITRDHRSFSKIQGLTPFSFRQYSQIKWEEIIKNKFYQNLRMER